MCKLSLVVYLFTQALITFWLIDNGNSGFIGEKSFGFFINFLPLVENEYFNFGFLFLALCFFILGSSINFKKIYKYFIKENRLDEDEKLPLKDETDDLMEVNESLTQGKQQSFSFKSFGNSNKTSSYKLPTLSLLEKNKNLSLSKSGTKNIEPDFLEKILLDFGVQGKIKKISNGPVVTLYEFEPAQ